MIVSMIKYLYKVIEEFPEVIKGTRSSPAGDHLFNVRKDEDQKFQFFPAIFILASATKQIARKLEPWHPPPSSHDHGRILDPIRSNEIAGVQLTDNAFSNDLNFCRVSELVARDAVSIPP